MKEHTPTPYQYDNDLGDNGFYVTSEDHNTIVAECSNKANAEFIVKACNEHDALVFVTLPKLLRMRELKERNK